MIINTLIVDDEQHARNMLESYVQQFSDFVLIAKCTSAMEAQTYLHQQKIDLIFLDIQMPKRTGIEFLRQLTNPPKIIFTTAFQEYALEGYELNVLDYLLKPIGFERFTQAIQKAVDIFSTKEKVQAYQQQQSFNNQFIIIKEGFSQYKIFLKDILYISAMQEYVQYHTKKGKRMELNSLANLEKVLPNEYFVRIHRSHIVSKLVISGKETKRIILNNEIILPIGKTYKNRISKINFDRG